jgi:hypothetical protein
MNCTYTTMSKSNIIAHVNNSITFFNSAYYIQFLNIAFCQFFTLSVLSDVHLCSSLTLLRKTNTIAEHTI